MRITTEDRFYQDKNKGARLQALITLVSAAFFVFTVVYAMKVITKDQSAEMSRQRDISISKRTKDMNDKFDHIELLLRQNQQAIEAVAHELDVKDHHR